MPKMPNSHIFLFLELYKTIGKEATEEREEFFYYIFGILKKHEYKFVHSTVMEIQKIRCLLDKFPMLFLQWQNWDGIEKNPPDKLL